MPKVGTDWEWGRRPQALGTVEDVGGREVVDTPVGHQQGPVGLFPARVSDRSHLGPHHWSVGLDRTRTEPAGWSR